MRHFHQFCKVTKTNIEIMRPFVYNVIIMVFMHRIGRVEEISS